MYVGMWFLVLAITALNVARPSAPQFLSSLFLPDGADAFRLVVVTLISSSLQAYILMCCVQCVQVIWATMFFFMFTMSDVAGGQQAEVGDVDANRKARVGLYRECQLLTNQYNNLLASFHAIIHAVVVILVTLYMYLFVRAEGMMAAVAAYLAVWSIPTYCELLNNYAEIQRGSKAFLESLNVSCLVDDSGNRMRTAIINRELRSFRELRIKAGSSGFDFDKQLVLTFVGIILSQCVNLLIMT